MSVYSTLLFLHVLGALGFFAALGLEWAGLRHVRQATSTGQAREWLRLAAAAGRVGAVSMVALVATGGYMMATAWGRVVWLSVTLGALVLMAVLALAITRPRMAAVLRSLGDAQEALSSASARSWGEGILWMSLQLRLGIAVAIVFLMAVKPGLTIAVTAVAIGALLGLVWGVLTGSGAPRARWSQDSFAAATGSRDRAETRASSRPSSCSVRRMGIWRWRATWVRRLPAFWDRCRRRNGSRSDVIWSAG